MPVNVLGFEPSTSLRKIKTKSDEICIVEIRSRRDNLNIQIIPWSCCKNTVTV